ncbi:hypothetical protein [Streptomyces mirabilis]|uniref:hypothetical protein n=1 Tax=Streptomyces mirabilis TaxID=68239 RepID=UPI00382B683C
MTVLLFAGLSFLAFWYGGRPPRDRTERPSDTVPEQPVLPTLPLHPPDRAAGSRGGRPDRHEAGAAVAVLPTRTKAVLSGRAVDGGVVFADAHDRAEPEETAPWWSPDPGLFTVFVAYEPVRAMFSIGALPLNTLQLAARIRACAGWEHRPVLLVCGSEPPGWVAQLLSDSLQTVVVSLEASRRWMARHPQRADRSSTRALDLGSSYPLTLTQKAQLYDPASTAAAPHSLVGMVASADHRGLALVEPRHPRTAHLLDHLREWREQDWQPGLFGVVVEHAPQRPDMPYRIGEQELTTWDLACVLWQERGCWQADSQLVAVLALPAADSYALQLPLLSTYLQVPVLPTNPSSPGQDTD